MKLINYESAEVRKALRGYWIYKLANLLFAFVIQIFIAKKLQPPSYATYAILLATLMAAERFFSLGIDRTILRFFPSLVSSGNLPDLRWLASRLGLVRLATLFAMLMLIALTGQYSARLMPTTLAAGTLYAFALWYVCYSLLADADAVAQSLIAHAYTTSINTLEILVRTAAIVVLSMSGYILDADTIVVISASTSFFAVAILGVRLWLFFLPTMRTMARENHIAAKSALDVKAASMFAAAAYASTIGWLISSPSVVRIVAKGGLEILAFAAFSFIQNLSVSMQRGLPGLLILPSLEPVMARFDGDEYRERMFAALSSIFKIELICVSSIIILSVVAGFDLIALLSRPEYAPFFYLLPAFMVILVMQTIYRICEIVMSVRLEHKVFLRLWPLSLISLVLLYATVGKWGLWSVLLIPLAESFVRLVFLFVAYRHLRIWLALDPGRSGEIVLSAAMIVAAITALRFLLDLQVGNVSSAAVCLLVFAASLFVVRPFRQGEIQHLFTMLPSSLNFCRKFMMLLARQEPIQRYC